MRRVRPTKVMVARGSSDARMGSTARGKCPLRAAPRNVSSQAGNLAANGHDGLAFVDERSERTE